MLNAFLEWASTKILELANHGYEGILTVSEDSSNRSARLDIDTELVAARITLWNSGDVVSEVIDVESESTIYSKHSHVADPFFFDKEFHDFFSIILIK